MTSQRREKIDNLLVDRALVGLSRAEEAELAELLADEGVTDDPSFDLAAAAVMLSAYPSPAALPGLPEHLAEKVERDARDHLATAARSRLEAVAPSALPQERRNPRSTTAAGAQVVVMPLSAPSPRGSDWTRWGGWAAAAALVCVALGPHLAPSSPPGVAGVARPASFGDARSIVVDAALPGSPAHAVGALVWSDASGRGQLRLRGLPAGRYELWIDDAARDNRHPLAAGALAAVDGAEVIADVAPAIAPRHAAMLRLTGQTADGRDPVTTLAVPLTTR